MKNRRDYIYTEVPEPVAGYILSPQKGYFSIVDPEERTNLVVNPSAEVDSTGYFAYGASVIIRSSAYAHRGIYSMRVSPTAAPYDGLRYTYGGITLAPGSAYAISVDVLAAPGVPMALTAYCALPPEHYLARFTGTGRWQRISGIFRDIAGAGYTILVHKMGSLSTSLFYVDGLQCELGTYPTTYIDGDQVGYKAGLLDYYWIGAVHSSISRRSANCRSGGRVVPIKDLGFDIMSIVGLGMATPANDIMPYGTLDGGEYHNSHVPSRQFTLAGPVFGRSQGDVQKKRKLIIDKIKPDLVIPRQPVVLRYTDQCTEPGITVEIPCVYTEGMGGQFDNYHQERIALTFTEPYPFLLEDGHSGIELTDINHMHIGSGAVRWVNGEWHYWENALIGAAVGTVYDIFYSNARGQTFFAGDYDTMGGNASWRLACQDYNTGLYTYYPNFADDAIRVLYETPNGRLYIGGEFAHIAGVNRDHVAYLPMGGPPTVDLTGGANDTVHAISTTYEGNVYIGGEFHSVGTGGGTVPANYFAMYDTAGIWHNVTPLGDFNGFVRKILTGSDGKVYVAGDFDTLNGVAGWNHVAVYNPVTGLWAQLGTGMTGGTVYDLCFGADGRLYACGTFTAPLYFAVFNGANWEWINGMAATAVGTTVIYKMCLGPDGRIYLAGDFAIQGPSMIYNAEYATWDGSTLGYLDAQPPRQADLQACDGLDICVTPFGAVWVSFNYVTAVPGQPFFHSAINTVDNIGSAIARPSIVCRVAVGVYNYLYIRNVDTGDELRFEINMDDGGWFFMNSTPGNLRTKSNYRTVEQMTFDGSDLATFKLIPGANHISVFSNCGAGAIAKTGMYWRNNYWGIDDVALDCECQTSFFSGAFPPIALGIDLEDLTGFWEHEDGKVILWT